MKRIVFTVVLCALATWAQAKGRKAFEAWEVTTAPTWVVYGASDADFVRARDLGWGFVPAQVDVRKEESLAYAAVVGWPLASTNGYPALFSVADQCFMTNRLEWTYAVPALRAKKQRDKPLVKKQKENRYFKACNSVLTQAGDPRGTNNPPVKFSLDDIETVSTNIASEAQAGRLMGKVNTAAASLSQGNPEWFEDLAWHGEVEGP
jgi:hypothetical protein